MTGPILSISTGHSHEACFRASGEALGRISGLGEVKLFASLGDYCAGGLPGDLRERLTEHAIDAFNAGRGVWAVDRSMDEPRIRNSSELMELAIWPKLYRRLAKFFRDPAEGPNPNIANFPAWLTAPGEDRNDQVLILTIGELATLNDIIEVNGNRVNMTRMPEELLIVPR